LIPLAREALFAWVKLVKEVDIDPYEKAEAFEVPREEEVRLQSEARPRRV
jgi:hypothetical protein